jgi:hypothetical protein
MKRSLPEDKTAFRNHTPLEQLRVAKAMSKLAKYHHKDGPFTNLTIRSHHAFSFSQSRCRQRLGGQKLASTFWLSLRLRSVCCRSGFVRQQLNGTGRSTILPNQNECQITARTQHRGQDCLLPRDTPPLAKEATRGDRAQQRRRHGPKARMKTITRNK